MKRRVEDAERAIVAERRGSGRARPRPLEFCEACQDALGHGGRYRSPTGRLRLLGFCSEPESQLLSSKIILLKDEGALLVTLATSLPARIATVATLLLPAFETFDELDEVGRLLGLLDETVLEKLLGRRAQKWVALEAERDELAERAREGCVECRWRVAWDDEEDLCELSIYGC